MNQPGSDSPVAESRSHWLTRGGAFLALTALFMGVALSQGLPSGLGRIVVPLSLAVCLQLFPLFWTRRTDPFEPASFHGIYNAVGLGSTLVVLLSQEKMKIMFLPGVPQSRIEEIVAQIAWVYVVGTVAYLVGYYSRAGKRARGLFSTRLCNLEWLPSRTLAAIVICALIAIPPYFVFQSRVGGSLLDVTQLKAGKEALRNDPTSSWIWRGVMIGFLPAMFLIVLAIRRKGIGGYLLAAGVIAISAILVLRLGQRAIVIFFLASCAIIYHYLKRRIPLAAIGGAIFVAVVVSNILLDYRVSDDPRQQRGITAERFNPTAAIEEHESDRARMSALAVVFHTFPDRHDYLLGESWYAWAALPIPRWLWPAKAQAFVWRETHIMVELRGIAIPIPYVGLLYANFSWVGVVIGMALWGMFQRGLYEWLKANERDPCTVIIYANFVIVNSPTLLALNWALLLVVPIVIVLLFIGVRPRAFTPGPSGVRLVAVRSSRD